MSDDIIRDNLGMIIESIGLVEERSSNIKSAEQFVNNSEGVLLLDAVSMRLQVVGELIKKIDKIDNLILRDFPEIDWIKIMKLRDIISHHYDVVDHEIIFDICKNHLPKLKSTITAIMEKADSNGPHK